MLSNSLNRGFRGSFTTILVTYVLIAGLSIFFKNDAGFYTYPNLFFNYLTSHIQSPFLIYLLNHFLLLGGISLVAYIVSNEEIVDKLNYFPVFIYLFLNVIIINKQQVSLFLVGNVAVLYSIYKIFNTYRQEHVLSNIYNACFWISVTLYLNIANIFIFPFIFVSLAILRPFNWREYAVALIGFFSPVFMYECLSYLFNFNQWYVFESMGELFKGLGLPVFNINFLPLMITTVLLFVFSIIQAMADGFGNTVKKQKAKSCFLWLMFMLIPTIFISGMSYESTFLLYSIPLSFFIGELFFNLRSTRIANILLVLFIFSTLFYLIKKTEWF